jgi:hypothetical protein
MTTKREFAYLVGGVGIGIYAPRLVPKLGVVKAFNYYKAAVFARKRLQRIVIENYHLIDSAIEAEEAFLKMINPHVTFTAFPISFEVEDDGNDRSIRMKIAPNKE